MEMENQELWQAVLGRLEICISKPSFATWFKGTQIIERMGEKLIIGVPNGFSKEWLKNKYNTDIVKAVRSVTPEVREIQYQIVSGPSQGGTQVATSVRASAPAAAPSISPAVNGLNPKYTFETFIVGEML